MTMKQGRGVLHCAVVGRRLGPRASKKKVAVGGTSPRGGKKTLFWHDRRISKSDLEHPQNTAGSSADGGEAPHRATVLKKAAWAGSGRRPGRGDPPELTSTTTEGTIPARGAAHVQILSPFSCTHTPFRRGLDLSSLRRIPLLGFLRECPLPPIPGAKKKRVVSRRGDRWTGLSIGRKYASPPGENRATGTIRMSSTGDHEITIQRRPAATHSGKSNRQYEKNDTTSVWSPRRWENMSPRRTRNLTLPGKKKSTTTPGMGLHRQKAT